MTGADCDRLDVKLDKTSTSSGGCWVRCLGSRHCTNSHTKRGSERVLTHGIGIWDVLAAYHREGSLDSAVRHAKPNDFDSLSERAPLLKKVCFNGKTAGRFAEVIAAAGYETLVLPSSSPANAMLSFEQKLAFWRAIRS